MIITCTTTYKYSDGLRQSKTVGGVTHSYRYDGNLILSENYTGTSMLFIYDENDSPIGFRYNNDYYTYAKNLHGDIVEIYDNAGNVVTKYVYDAWGNIISTTGSRASTVGAANPFRYRGYYWDSETGLYWLYTRYYDPTIGRFINADGYLFENIQGFNLYAYCYNNPVMYVDYDGEDAAALLERWNQQAPDLMQADGPYPVEDIFVGLGYVVIGFVFVYEAVEVLINAAEDTPTDESDAPKNIDDSDNDAPKEVPNVKYPGDDPSKSPGEGYEWRGQQPVGGDKGAWKNSRTGEQYHPDLNHKPPKRPHYDYKDRFGYWWDLYKEGIDPGSWR